MKMRLLAVWEAVRTSFWFIPSLMVIAAAGLAVGLVNLDRLLQTDFGAVFFSGGVEGARSILSTIAGSMITIAGVTFSITIVALTLTSSQFGSRMLRNFMADRGNQLVLGTFIATFMYCLLVMKSIPLAGGAEPVPGIAVAFSFVLALVDLGVLIYFYHHVSNSIHADNIIESVTRELERAIERFSRDNQGPEAAASMPCRDFPDLCENPIAVLSHSSGYLRAVDETSLVEIAEKQEAIIHLHYRPGEYVFINTPLATISPVAESDFSSEAVQNAFILGNRRTPEQDIEFAVCQLVEVALRALSPGINDPFTAISCINRLGNALCRLSQANFPPHLFFDSQEKLRLVTKAFTYAGILDTAFNQIRQAAKDSVAVHVRLLETLASVAGTLRHPQRCRAIAHHAMMTRRAARKNIHSPNDLEDIEKRYYDVMKSVAMCRMGPVKRPLS